MIDKSLSERKQKILKAVVDEYIISASPISSAAIKDNYLDNVSSATIRSELSTLEDMGYLIKPHTSAGRIPSKLAYKMYVENFIECSPLQKHEIEAIEKSFEKRYTRMSEIVRQTAKVISEITNYTSVMLVSDINKVRIKEVKLLGLDEHKVLVVIITDSGIIRDNIITLKNSVNSQYIQEANLLINNVFSNKTLKDIKSAQDGIEKELQEFKELYDCIIEIMMEHATKSEDNLVVEGTSKIANYPEASAKNFLSVIDKKNEVAKMLEKDSDIQFGVTIGRDEKCGIEDCAIVSVKYTINGEEIGHAGVIGPERMDYNKVMSVLNYIGKTLDIVIHKDNEKEDDDEER